MGGFIKLFGSILDSTIWDTPPAITKVWITMMAMADRDGVVSASVPGLARRARVSMAIAEKALETFMAPDPHSKSQELEGRRIQKVEGGWSLVNYEKHRDDRGTGKWSNPATSDKPGRVYFIRCGTAIKIGFSQNPWARLNTLKTGSPVAPELIGHFAGTMDDEHDLHRKFAASKVNLEWYADTADLRAEIEARCHTSSPGDEYRQLPPTTSELPRLRTATIEADSEAEVDPGSESVSSSPQASSWPQAGARSNESATLGPRHERARVFLGACTPDFLAVYDRYPRKEGKQDAAQVFQEVAEAYPGGEAALSAAILAAFDAGMLSRAPYHGPNKTRPMLDKVLANRRWEDPPSAPDDVEPTKPAVKPWLAAEKAGERERASDRAQQRIAQAEMDRLMAGEKAVG